MMLLISPVVDATFVVSPNQPPSSILQDYVRTREHATTSFTFLEPRARLP